MLKTIAFFEAKGKGKLKADDRDRVWNSDFVEFQMLKEGEVFAFGLSERARRWIIPSR
jgi:acyl-CoA dehydrogenase